MESVCALGNFNIDQIFLRTWNLNLYHESTILLARKPLELCLTAAVAVEDCDDSSWHSIMWYTVLRKVLCT